MAKVIPIFWPYMNSEMSEAVSRTLKTRWLGQGPKVDEFEQKFAKKFGVKYPVSVNSGTAALELAYELIGIGKGDEVITTPLTCTATNIPLVRRGAKLVFADVMEDTLNINPDDIRKKITKKTKAIVNVNLGGIKSDIGKNWPVPVVTDSAQALGFFNGDYVINSFQAIKHFTTGDGGMLTCPNKTTYKKAKLLRWFGIDREKKRAYDWQAYKKREMTFDIEYLGFKYQMNDIAASMGIVGLKYYQEVLNRRAFLFNAYKKRLEGLNDIVLLDSPNNVYWLATVLVERRDAFAKTLKDAGIETNLVQVRNDIYKIFGGKRQNLYAMNGVEPFYLSLPLHPKMTLKDVKYICKVIKKGW